MGPHNSTIPRERIAQLAYQLWQARGCPTSDGVEDWIAAEQELLCHDQPGLLAALRKVLAARMPKSARGLNYLKKLPLKFPRFPFSETRAFHGLPTWTRRKQT